MCLKLRKVWGWFKVSYFINVQRSKFINFCNEIKSITSKLCKMCDITTLAMSCQNWYIWFDIKRMKIVPSIDAYALMHIKISVFFCFFLCVCLA